VEAEEFSWRRSGPAYAGDFGAAVNGHWSPLYPVILATFIAAFQSDSFLEFSIVRGVDFIIFLTTISAFQAFLTRLANHCYGKVNGASEFHYLLSRPQLFLIGYVLLAWGASV
jgi:hypothetical protein